MSSPQKKSERKRSRLRRLLFRRGGPSSARSTDPHATPRYGAVDETGSWQNGRHHGDEEDPSLPSLPSLRQDENEAHHAPAPTWMFWRSPRPDLQTVANVQVLLRYMVLLTGSFMLGAHFSTAVWGQEYVEKALEYSLVAWITCIILGLLLSYSYARGDGIMRPSSSYDEEEGV